MKKYSIPVAIFLLLVAGLVAAQFFKYKEKQAAQEIHFKAVPITPESAYKNHKF
ncbi:MAG: hypothetical protein PHI29_01570 [Gallionella sp.]|nr:hypothetical protein [Gallionella sp.]